MTAAQRLPAFEKFIQDLRAAWAECPNIEAHMKKGAELLEGLVNDETMRAAAKSWPSTEGRKNLLFYEDPDYGFAINGVVRLAGRKGSIHDHAMPGPHTACSTARKASNASAASMMHTRKAIRNWNWQALPKEKPEKWIWCRPSTSTRNKAVPRAR
jgi:hypothetical protein